MRKGVYYNISGMVCFVLTFVTTGQTKAADYLRGIFETAPPSFAAPVDQVNDTIDWSGIYGGVFAGSGSTEVKQTSNGLSLVNDALPYNPVGNDLAILVRFKDQSVRKLTAGGFLGYNMVWDDVVLGLEADYTRSNVQSKSSYQEGRRFSDPSSTTRFYTGQADSSAQAKLTDWVTLRGRVGWATGNFMPFVTAGVALGNLKSSYSTALTLTQYENVTLTDCPLSPCTYPMYVSGGSVREGKLKSSGAYFGLALGAGVDFAISQNFFLRTEWQYIQFASDKNKPDISVNVARIAGAMKF